MPALRILSLSILMMALAGCEDGSPTEASLRGTALLPERLYGEAKPAMEWGEPEAAEPPEAALLLVLRGGRLEGRFEQRILAAAGDTLTLVTVFETGPGTSFLEPAPDGARSGPGGTVDESAGAVLRLSGSGPAVR